MKRVRAHQGDARQGIADRIEDDRRGGDQERDESHREDDELGFGQDECQDDEEEDDRAEDPHTVAGDRLELVHDPRRELSRSPLPILEDRVDKAVRDSDDQDADEHSDDRGFRDAGQGPQVLADDVLVFRG